MRISKGKTLRSLFLILFLIFSLIVAGCSEKDMTEERQYNESGTDITAADIEENEGKDEKEKETEIGKETVSFEIINKDPKNVPEDQGSFEIRIEGEIFEEDDNVVIQGTSNLLPGAYLEGFMEARNHTVWGYSNSAKVENDGSYRLKISKPNFHDIIEFKVKFRPHFQKDHIKEYYGENGEKLEGPLIYLNESNGKLYKEVKIRKQFHFTPEMKINYSIDQPNWDRPDDYGDPDVWILPEIKKDDKYIYIQGKSNLLEGSRVDSSFSVTGYTLIGYTSSTRVNPDGSFELETNYPTGLTDKEMFLYLRFTLDEYTWEPIKERYGEKGEKLEGKLVNVRDDGTKEIKLEIKLDFN